MRALRLQWSWAFSLVCEVALSVLNQLKLVDFTEGLHMLGHPSSMWAWLRFENIARQLAYLVTFTTYWAILTTSVSNLSSHVLARWGNCKAGHHWHHPYEFNMNLNLGT